ncbi:MAG: hypothetical protein LBI86_03450 [Treponema sp.]|nr:hypothetical protein [Treponema sp.]
MKTNGVVKKVLFLTSACAALFLASCKTEPVIFNPDLPKDQQTSLYIMEGLTVVSYNGIPVNWKNKTDIFLPAGDMELIFDVNSKMSFMVTPTNSITYTFTGTNVPFNYRFEAGKRYNLFFTANFDELNTGGISFHLPPYSIDKKREWLYEDNDSKKFFPFSKSGQLRWRRSPF